jgi:hypothetical protein
MGAISINPIIQPHPVINLKKKGGKFEDFRLQVKRRCSFNPNPASRRKEE